MGKTKNSEYIEIENKEWLDSLRWVLNNETKERVGELLTLLHNEAKKEGISPSLSLNTPYRGQYLNTYLYCQ